MNLKSLKNLLIVLCCVNCTALVAQQWQMPPATIEVDTVENTMLAASIDIPANLVSQNFGWVSAETTGRLNSLLAIGTVVKKGDVIAEIRHITLKAQRQEQATSVQSAEAQISYLRNQVKRLNELRSKNIAALSQLEETQSQLDVAISNKVAAQARLAQVDIGIAASKLRAQFDGTITEHGIQPGEWASPGREVIRVVNLAAKEVLARTALENIRFLKTGDELEISDGKNTGKVQLAAMVPIGEISDGVYELRFSLLSGDWRVGQSLSIKVPQSQSSSVLTIPRDAILLRSGGSSIIRLIDDSSFERISVQTGLGNTDRIEVRNSEKQLAAGDRVIIRGGERLQDGQEFVIKN